MHRKRFLFFLFRVIPYVLRWQRVLHFTPMVHFRNFDIALRNERSQSYWTRKKNSHGKSPSGLLFCVSSNSVAQKYFFRSETKGLRVIGHGKRTHTEKSPSGLLFCVSSNSVAQKFLFRSETKGLRVIGHGKKNSPRKEVFCNFISVLVPILWPENFL